jgi:hypothetical protein
MSTSTVIPPMDSATGSVGDASTYARSNHSHPINVSATNPAMNGTASVGTSSNYARSDHVHPTDTSLIAKTASKSILLADGTNTIPNNSIIKY